MAKIVFAMEWLPSYRTGFYELLQERIHRRGHQLELVHGDAPLHKKARGDAKMLEWASYAKNGRLVIRGTVLAWQPVMKHIRSADLVVVQQEAGLLLNWVLLPLQKLGGPRVAIWGHGENPNPIGASGPAEWLKRKASPYAHWAFAYTDRSAQIFADIGFPSDKITVVQNSMDIEDRVHPAEPPSDEVKLLVDGLATRGAFAAGAITGFDALKGVDRLVQIIDECRAAVPTFEFLAVGGGDDIDVLIEAAESRSYLHVLGPRFGGDVAALGHAMNMMIMPSAIGLHVLDSFAFGAPFMTENSPLHSHEFDYLEPGVNSIVLEIDASPLDYGRSVADLVANVETLNELSGACRTSATKYTVETMVENFAVGLEKALE